MSLDLLTKSFKPEFVCARLMNILSETRTAQLLGIHRSNRHKFGRTRARVGRSRQGPARIRPVWVTRLQRVSDGTWPDFEQIVAKSANIGSLGHFERQNDDVPRTDLEQHRAQSGGLSLSQRRSVSYARPRTRARGYLPTALRCDRRPPAAALPRTRGAIGFCRPCRSTRASASAASFTRRARSRRSMSSVRGGSWVQFGAEPVIRSGCAGHVRCNFEFSEVSAKFGERFGPHPGCLRTQLERVVVGQR